MPLRARRLAIVAEALAHHIIWRALELTGLVTPTPKARKTKG